MNLRDFDFTLPESLIALSPAPERDSSRLFVLGRDGSFAHGRFRDITGYLREGDMLLLNKTKVIPARLAGKKPTGGRLDMLLVREIDEHRWEILCKKKYNGRVSIGGMSAVVGGGFLTFAGTREEILSLGETPLPPYIKREPDHSDKVRYQTVYAEDEGSIAAPTAGLHFTPALIEDIKKKGVLVRYLTLHVGKGTFMPVRVEDVRGHRMEAEFFDVPQALLKEIADVKAGGGRLTAVGTTATRAIEAVTSGRYRPLESPNGTIRGSTDIFIYPGCEFRAVDALITNFHLPRSTPLMLASALAGRERLLEAYGEAIRAGYRFFSYGDAMLITG